jgi:hypothetical protein
MVQYNPINHVPDDPGEFETAVLNTLNELREDGTRIVSITRILVMRKWPTSDSTRQRIQRVMARHGAVRQNLKHRSSHYDITGVTA